jgi:hypothetical protein
VTRGNTFCSAPAGRFDNAAPAAHRDKIRARVQFRFGRSRELECLDEMLTVNRLRLPPELRRSLACTNAIENMQGTIRRVTRNVKRWRDASMALRLAAAGMLEAKAGFRRLKSCRQLPALRRALAEHHSRRLATAG